MYHFGAASLIAASCAFFPVLRLKAFCFSTLAILIVSLGRIFGIPGLSTVLDLTPGLKSIGEQYWFIAVACTFSIAAGLAVESIYRATSKAVWIPVRPARMQFFFFALGYIFVGIMALLLQISSLFFFFFFFFFFYKQICVTIVLLAASTSVALIAQAASQERFRKVACSALLIVCGSELIFNFMYYRLLKGDFFPTLKFCSTNAAEICRHRSNS